MGKFREELAKVREELSKPSTDASTLNPFVVTIPLPTVKNAFLFLYFFINFLYYGMILFLILKMMELKFLIMMMRILMIFLILLKIMMMKKLVNLQEDLLELVILFNQNEIQLQKYQIILVGKKRQEIRKILIYLTNDTRRNYYAYISYSRKRKLVYYILSF